MSSVPAILRTVFFTSLVLEFDHLLDYPQLFVDEICLNLYPVVVEHFFKTKDCHNCRNLDGSHLESMLTLAVDDSVHDCFVFYFEHLAAVEQMFPLF